MLVVCENQLNLWYFVLMDLSCRDNDPVPPGGFMKMFENQSENSHLVGRTSHGAPPVEELAATPPARGNQNMDKEQSGRIDKRILWTQDEDLRVVSNLVTSLFTDMAT